MMYHYTMQNEIQKRLLNWAAFFLFVQSIILTLSPAVRERSWDVDYRLSHWIGFFAWLALTHFAQRTASKYLPDHDPYIFPAAAFLSGWGLLTIWRLNETFGIRQALWLGVSLAVFIFAIRVLRNIGFLRRFKYVILSGGLLITTLTLFFGVNPLGFGPRLWLGCCGVYFQPSELLKLLLIIYLSAYLADRTSIQLFSFPLLLPTLAMTGVALLLLLVQRDLGTTFIFISIFTIVTYLATGKRRILLSAGVLIALFTSLGYFFIDIIRIRVVGWLNPWLDPSGNSYQIVQSLLSVANGGTIGRGLGIGSPLLVPVAISDFIFTAVAEETGLIGSLGMLALIWLILARGMIISLRAVDRFRRYLAAGVVTYLGVQSLLIIGGNIRLLPLTGVTLPFVSYGGSSLLTSFIALFLLLVISNTEDSEPAPLHNAKAYPLLAGVLALGLFASAAMMAWWAIARGPDLLSRTDNPRRAIADRYVPRGMIVDKNNRPISTTEVTAGSGIYSRLYVYTELSSVIGYTHPVYGQAGLEASLDNYLRGLQGNPSTLILWDQLIYGTPPRGLDVRLSIDLALQSTADNLLGSHHGAIILMNAETGEILVMASHPTYDANKLSEEGESLAQNPASPLLNRATQGLYPVGNILLPLLQAEFGERQPSDGELRAFYERLGLYRAPTVNMPVAFSAAGEVRDLFASPLQVGTAAATLSHRGILPAPRIATAVNTPEQGWVVLPAGGAPLEVIQAEAAREAAITFAMPGKPYWSHIGQSSTEQTTITWLVAGSLPDWQGTPLVLVVTLEENNTFLAEFIAENMFNAGLSE
jgi:cell division protein FtsW (lipid II flippase)